MPGAATSIWMRYHDPRRATSWDERYLWERKRAMDALPPGAPPHTSFGALLRRYRTAAGLTQEELAERAGLSVRNLRDLERDTPQRPQQATFERLAVALAVPATDYPAFVAAARRRDAQRPEPAPSPAGPAPAF